MEKVLSMPLQCVCERNVCAGLYSVNFFLPIVRDVHQINTKTQYKRSFSDLPFVHRTKYDLRVISILFVFVVESMFKTTV